MKRIYKTKDILLSEDPQLKVRSFSCFSDFMKEDVQDYLPKRSYEERGFFLAKKIVTAFWECIIEDMMDNDTSISFSTKPMMLLKISFLTNFNSKKYYFYKETGGKFYKMFMIVGKKFSDAMNCYFFTYSQRKFKKVIMSKIEQGHTWSQIE